MSSPSPLVTQVEALGEVVGDVLCRLLRLLVRQLMLLRDRDRGHRRDPPPSQYSQALSDAMAGNLARSSRAISRGPRRCSTAIRPKRAGATSPRASSPSLARWQAAFRREGLAPGDRIALAARNGVDWVAIDLAALGLGLVVVPLYVDDNPENVAWCVANAEAKLLIVENSGSRAALANPASGATMRCRRVWSCWRRRSADGDERALTLAEFLPAAATQTFEVRDGVRRHAGDDLLHVRNRGTAQGRDAVARQHRRECRRMPRDRAWRVRRRVPVDPAAVAHVRAHRRLLPAAVRSARRSSTRAASRRLADDLAGAGADGDVRGAADLRALRRAHRAARSRPRR